MNEQDENFKIQDLERKIFTPARNQLMCETFLKEAQKDPEGKIGKSIVFAVNQTHATNLTKAFNELVPGIAVTITSRIKDASSIAKEFRDSKRPERIAVSVDMLSTGYNCRDLLNIGLMRPIFSPTEYIQIKGRGTRRYTFKVGHTEYEKKNFFMLDFCAVAEYFEEKYDYSVPLKVPREAKDKKGRKQEENPARVLERVRRRPVAGAAPETPREIPVWEGTDILTSREVIEVGPDGEKVDVMTFRGSFERDVKEFAEADVDMSAAIADEDDDAVETLMNERFYHRPEMYYSPDKLVRSYGVPAFLIASFTHILREHTKAADLKRGRVDGGLLKPAQWRFLEEQAFTGYDNDANMVKIAILNLYLHQLERAKVALLNPLTTGFGGVYPGQRFDVILANPPFAGKVQDESILSDLNYKLNTRATELLFLKWFIDHLTKGGRAGVIVPNGVLFGSNNAATTLRETAAHRVRPASGRQPAERRVQAVLRRRHGGADLREGDGNEERLVLRPHRRRLQPRRQAHADRGQ